jgi:hypothetical protein
MGWRKIGKGGWYERNRLRRDKSKSAVLFSGTASRTQKRRVQEVMKKKRMDGWMDGWMD